MGFCGEVINFRMLNISLCGFSRIGNFALKQNTEMNEKKTEKEPSYVDLIDVEKAIKDKNPKILKWMPKFLLKSIKKKIHQDELNDLFYRTRNGTNAEFLETGLKEMGPTITVSGLENLPKTGGVYVTANHPLGGIDGAALIQACLKVRPDNKFFVNDILMQVTPMQKVFVPVNKHGRNDKNYRDRFEEIYSSDNCLIIFPAGLVSRRQKKRKIEDLRWKKSIIQKSIQYDKPILPVHIDARNSNKFYNLAFWRKKLGIKANIEMFYLADEMYKQNGKKIHLTFGKPISASHFDKTKKPEEWVQWLKEKVYSLKGK
ncbi:MAG: putative hemolysin [Flavobacteriales bacterium]